MITKLQNIPQIKRAAEDYRSELKTMLKDRLRTVGLREKLEKRVDTLDNIIEILEAHIITEDMIN